MGYADRALVNHPRLRTVYPPLAEATFYGVAAAGGGVLAFKLLFGAFDLLTAAAVWWLADAKRRRQATVLYLLCPAVIVQTWGAAHLEIVAVSLVVLAAAALLRGRDWQAGVLLGLAAAFKVTPAALLVPALLGGRAKPARFLAGFIPALVLPYVPYLLSGGAFGSLFESGTGWTGGALLFALLARIVDPEVARTPVRGGLPVRRRVDRPVPSGPGAHGAGLRLDDDLAGRLPAGGARLVLARAAGSRPGRRHLAAGRDRAGRSLPRGACRPLAGAVARRGGGVAAARPPRRRAKSPPLAPCRILGTRWDGENADDARPRAAGSRRARASWP